MLVKQIALAAGLILTAFVSTASAATALSEQTKTADLAPMADVCQGSQWKSGDPATILICQPTFVNGGSVPLTFTVTVSSTPCAWLSASPTSGSIDAGAALVLNVSATPGCITNTGTYSGTVTVTSSGGTFTHTADITVTQVSQGLAFYPVTPCRVADTRAAAGFTGAFGPPSLTPTQQRDIPIPSGVCGIPSTAVAYSLNVTAIPPGYLGLLTIWPTGQSRPNASILNSYLGTVVPNAAIVPAGTNGAVSLFASEPTDVAMDITGYFAPLLSTGLEFYPLSPCRVVETRLGTGPLAGPALSGNTQRDFPVLSSSCGLPSSARAYSFNFTAIPGGYLGFLTTWPTGGSRPVVSTLNSYLSTVVSNAALVPAGANGAVSVFVTDATNLVIDTNGYFAPPAAQGLLFHPVTPCRVVDTRAAAGLTGAFGPPTMGANTQRSFPIPSGSFGIPSTAKAYSMNVTVVPQGYLGFLTIWPTGLPLPNVSTLNSYLSTVVSNAVLVPAASDGSVSVFVTDPTDVILDINGYFTL